MSGSNGDETLSPSKTLKLTLKVTKSPGNSANRRKEHDAAQGEETEEGDYQNKVQDAPLAKSPPMPTAGVSATAPMPLSHNRKPSIFGTATLEEDEQQDEADPEDGELSEAGDDLAGKDEHENENGEGDNAAMGDEKVEDSEAEENDGSGKYAFMFRI